MKLTSLNTIHKNLGAKLVDFAGFEMPVQYTSIKEEHFAVRERVGIFDVSHMGEFVIKGKDATNLLQYICTNDIQKIENFQCQYNCMPNEKGGIIDDLIVYKWNDLEYNLVVNASNIEKDFNWIVKIKNEMNFEVEITDISDECSLIALQGPKATELLQELTNVDLSSIKYYHFASGSIAGLDDIIISNTGYTGSGGFELYVWNKDAASLWNELMNVGEKYGILPCGLASRDTLRLEKGFCLYGNDIDDTTSPLEANLGWITKFNKNFVAKEILEKQKKEGITKKLVGFKMLDKGIPRHDYLIKDNDNNVIGKVTSGTSSPMLNIGIGLGYVSINNSTIGETIYIEVRDKLLKAEVVKLPFV